MFGRHEPDFVIADKERPGEGNHVAFRADTRAQVDAFHAAALAAGGRDNGGPGLRDHYGPNYYAAFALDPDGSISRPFATRPLEPIGRTSISDLAGEDRGRLHGAGDRRGLARLAPQSAKPRPLNLTLT